MSDNKECDEKECGGCGGGKESCEDTERSLADRLDGESDENYADRMAIAKKMGTIAHKVMVMSGKGGVGKSTVSVNLAVTLAMNGASVGLLDVDFHGPSVPKLLNLENRKPIVVGETLKPVEYAFKNGKLLVMSVGFMLRSVDDAVIWRGPMKMGAVRQFIRDVKWGLLDFLIIDAPPGTGDEPLAVAQMMHDIDGAIVVTTPQDLALIDVRKSITFCKRLDVPVLGVVENMSGLKCPHCGGAVNVFKTGGGLKMARDMGVPFLGSIPIEPDVVTSGDSGQPFVLGNPGTETAMAFERISIPILALKRPEKKKPRAKKPGGEK